MIKKEKILEIILNKCSNCKSGRRALGLLYFVKHKKRLLEYRVMSVQEYSRENHRKVTYFEKDEEREATIVPAIYGSDFYRGGVKRNVPIYPCYMTEIENGTVTGYTDGVIAGNCVLNDRKDYNPVNIYEAARPVYCISIDDKREYMLAVNVRHEKILERALYISGRFPHNWWHYTFELVSRISLYDKNPEYDDWPILADDTAVNDKSSFKLLQLLNYKKRPVIVMKRNEHVLVHRLAYASVTVTETIGTYADAYMNESDACRVFYFFSNRNSVSYIRKHVLQNMNHHPSGKIFVARKRKGRLVNEKEAAAFFQSMGFETVYSDSLSFEEEISIFSNAEIIISTMGAAMTNLLYISPAAKVICIFPQKSVSALTGYQEIADIVGFQFYIQDARIVKDSEKYPCIEYILLAEDCQKLCRDLNLIPKA